MQNENKQPEHLRSEVWPFSLAKGLFPLHTLRPLRDELHMTGVRMRTRSMRRRYVGATDLLVNVGCGDLGQEGWMNIDAYPAKGVSCVYDCRKSLPFPDASARGIFTEHFVEHIDYQEEAPFFLADCARVLQPGGVLRIVVPDAEKYLRAYVSEGWEEMCRIHPILYESGLTGPGTYHTKMEVVNVHFRQGHQHKFVYDYETLESLLSRSGFSKVYHQEYGRSVMPELCLDMPQRAAESLYVDAVK